MALRASASSAALGPGEQLASTNVIGSPHAQSPSAATASQQAEGSFPIQNGLNAMARSMIASSDRVTGGVLRDNGEDYHDENPESAVSLRSPSLMRYMILDIAFGP